MKCKTLFTALFCVPKALVDVAVIYLRLYYAVYFLAQFA